MVKLGLICEGESGLIIFDTDEFKAFLAGMSIDLVGVVETGSKTQYFEDRLIKHRSILIDRGAEKVIALIDLDADTCITETKNKIQIFDQQTVVVAVKEFENWYLADSNALSRFTEQKIVIEHPEQDNDALTTIIDLYKKRFPKSKPRLAKTMKRYGFSVENAANHPNCPSARYFLTKLQTLATANK